MMWIIAIGHTALALSDSTWRTVVRAGVVGAAANDGPTGLRAFGSLYFLTAGIMLMALAHLAQTTLRHTGRIPATLGGYLLVGGGVLVLVEFPNTGAWALLVLGGYTLYAARGAQLPISGDRQPQPHRDSDER